MEGVTKVRGREVRFPRGKGPSRFPDLSRDERNRSKRLCSGKAGVGPQGDLVSENYEATWSVNYYLVRAWEMLVWVAFFCWLNVERT